MPSLLRRLAARLRPASNGGDAAPKSPIRALLDAVSDQLERLADALEGVYDDSYVGTGDGQRRPRVSDRLRKDDP